MDIYKKKYLKYKFKYLKEKEKEKNKSYHKIGGKILSPIILEYPMLNRSERKTELNEDNIERFKNWYDEESQTKNSFEIFLNLCSSVSNNETYNILVGCDNIYDYDYEQFKKSEKYSLYIDNSCVKRDPVKQYYMFTIDYENLKNGYREIAIDSYVRMINEINFDLGVSFHAPIYYLDIAQYLLPPEGKIIWDLADDKGLVINYDGNNYLINDRIIQKEELEERYKVIINSELKTIEPLNESFFEDNKMSPQTFFTIIYENRLEFKKNIEEFFLNYCKNRYPELEFELKTYNFMEYSYPVPLKTEEIGSKIYKNIKTNIPFVNFVVNTVMNNFMKNKYLKNKIIGESLYNHLIEEIFTKYNNEMLRYIPNYKSITNQVSDHIPKLTIKSYFDSVFKKEYKYIKATKK